MAQAGKSALAALSKHSVAAMMRNCAPQSAALASTSSPVVSAYDSQRASMASAAAPASKQNAAEFVVTKVRRRADVVKHVFPARPSHAPPSPAYLQTISSPTSMLAAALRSHD